MRPDYPRPEQESQLKCLWKQAFGDTDDFISLFFTSAYDRKRCRCLTENGAVTAALYWLDGSYRGQKIAYLYAVATHPDHRGKGMCRQLMADTHSLLKEQGYAAALLTPAGDGLRQMYAGMGYRACCTVSEVACTAGAKVPLERVDGETYGILRRAYLPEDGVVQEGPSLAFLEGYCELYAGENFLCAAAAENGSLRCMELLGDPQAAPGILAALGCGEGRFRMPGKGKAFSMCCPLVRKVEVPGYLGLAFD